MLSEIRNNLSCLSCQFCNRTYNSLKLYELHKRNCIYKNFYLTYGDKLNYSNINKILLLINLLCFYKNPINKNNLLMYIEEFISSNRENYNVDLVTESIKNIITCFDLEWFTESDRLEIISKFLNIEIDHIIFIKLLYEKSIDEFFI